MKNKLLFLNIFLFIGSIYFGLLIFNVKIKSPFNKAICDHCNVILISLDTLGANHLPCYGYSRNTAENTCNFAENNIFFTNAFSNASWTLPSHFSIFTSLYPNHHNMINYDKNILDPSIATMAELFKKANYKTIYSGFLNDPSLPLDRGLGRGFEILSGPLTSQSLSAWEKSIKQLITNNKNKQKTFLFLHTYFVHDPYVVNNVSEGDKKRVYTKDFYPDIPLDWKSYWEFSKEFRSYVLNRYENKVQKDSANDKEKNQNIVAGLKNAKDLSDAETIYNKLVTDQNAKFTDFSSFYFSHTEELDGKVVYLKDLYDEMIYRLDKKMSIIFDLAKNPELASNTIIIITSDHGEEFKEHGGLTHPVDHLYNTTTSVPLIMYIPGIKHKKINDLVQSIDILPTILRVTGIGNVENKFDGIDVTDSILGRSNTKRNDYLISEGSNDSIRNGKWKFYTNNLQKEINIDELYDLSTDPQEKKNLVENEPNIVKDLYDNLSRIIYKK